MSPPRPRRGRAASAPASPRLRPPRPTPPRPDPYASTIPVRRGRHRALRSLGDVLRAVGGSTDPVGEFFSWDEEPDERTLVALLRLTAERDRTFSWERHEFPKGAVVYVSRRSGKRSRYGHDTPVEYVYRTGRGDAVFVRRDPVDFMTELSEDEDYGAYYEDFDDVFNREFWENPPTLYHGTNELESVLADGIEARCESRSLYGGPGDAVYATTEWDEAATYVRYWDVGGVVEIDTGAMKRDGYTPYAAREPEVTKSETMGAIASHLGIEWEYEFVDSSITYEAMYFGCAASIPAKYLRATEPRRNNPPCARRSGRRTARTKKW